MTHEARRLPLSARGQFRAHLTLLGLALLLVTVPPCRAVNLFLLPVAAGQVLVRHALGVQDLRLHRLGGLHILGCGVIIGVTGAAAGQPWAGVAGALGVALLALLDFLCWQLRRAPS